MRIIVPLKSAGKKTSRGKRIRITLADANQLRKKLPRLIKILDAIKRARDRPATIARANERSMLPMELASRTLYYGEQCFSTVFLSSVYGESMDDRTKVVTIKSD